MAGGCFPTSIQVEKHKFSDNPKSSTYYSLHFIHFNGGLSSDATIDQLVDLYNKIQVILKEEGCFPKDEPKKAKA